MSEQKITIGVGLMPLVVSQKEGRVGEVIQLKLIEGLTPAGIIWRNLSCAGQDVPTLENLTVVFQQAGTYIPVILGHPQHISYAIQITD
jgi:hypothetical protein